MLYCSVEEAWGNYTYENNKKTELSEEKPIKKENKPSKVNNQEEGKIIENFTESLNEENILSEKNLSEKDCNKIIKHVSRCRKCQNKLKEMLTPKLINLLKNLLEDYRDLFVLLLVGISILLFFNLVSNISN